MAFNINTFFTRIGKLVKYHNTFETLRSSLVTYVDAIKDQYNDNRSLVSSLDDNFGDGTVDGWQSELQSVAQNTLVDSAADLSADSKSVQDCLDALSTYMVDNSATINATDISTPVVTTDAGNTGTGFCYVYINTIDGVEDERIKDEAIRVTCVRDKYTGSTVENERWEIVGDPDINGRTTTSTMRNLLTDGDFENWDDSTTPTSWTVDAGSGEAVREAVYGYEDSALQFLGGNVSAVIVSQEVSLSVDKTYFLHFMLRGSVTSPGSTFSVSITGDDDMSEQVLYTIDPSTLTTSFAAKSAWFQLPDNPDTTLTLNINWDDMDLVGSGETVTIDKMILGLPTDFGHVQYAIVPGNEPFLRGDQFTLSTARASSGAFSAFFADVFDHQLPSSTTGAETISDALAT